MAKTQSKAVPADNEKANQAIDQPQVAVVETQPVDIVEIDAEAKPLLVLLQQGVAAAHVAGDHASYAALDELHHLTYSLKLRAQDAVGKLSGELQDLAKRIAEL